jgi:hypothetical protein
MIDAEADRLRELRAEREAEMQRAAEVRTKLAELRRGSVH